MNVYEFFQQKEQIKKLYLKLPHFIFNLFSSEEELAQLFKEAPVDIMKINQAMPDLAPVQNKPGNIAWEYDEENHQLFIYFKLLSVKSKSQREEVAAIGIPFGGVEDPSNPMKIDLFVPKCFNLFHAPEQQTSIVTWRKGSKELYIDSRNCSTEELRRLQQGTYWIQTSYDLLCEFSQNYLQDLFSNQKVTNYQNQLTLTNINMSSMIFESYIQLKN